MNPIDGIIRTIELEPDRYKRADMVNELRRSLDKVDDLLPFEPTKAELNEEVRHE